MQAGNAAVRQPLMLHVEPPFARMPYFTMARLTAVADNCLAQRLAAAGVDVIASINEFLRQALQRCANSQPGSDHRIEARHLVIPGQQALGRIVDHHAHGQRVEVEMGCGLHS